MATKTPTTAEHTFCERYGPRAGEWTTAIGDVVKVEKTFADVKWRRSGRTERVRLDDPDVVFK